MSLYPRYYDAQIGGGGGTGVKNVFSGSTYQRGRGVGAWLGGLARKIMPYLTQGMKTVGKEAVRASLNIFDDVADNRATFKDSLRTRARESGGILKRKAADKIIAMMKGQGIKSSSSKRRRQSKKKRSTVRKAAASGGVRKKKRKVRRVKKTKKTSARKSSKRKKTYRDISDIFGPR